MPTSPDLIIQAINAVSSLTQTVHTSPHVPPDSNGAPTNGQDLVAAIVVVSATVSNRRGAPTGTEPTSEPKQPLAVDHGALRAVHEIAFSWVSQTPQTNLTGVDCSFSVMTCLDRSHNENLHSDFIAGLLRPSVTDDLARHLFVKLFALGSNNTTAIAEEIRDLGTYRERRLDAIEPTGLGPNKAAKRIDILSISDHHVLVIENKILAFESDNQTRDYVSVIKKRYGRRWHLSFVLLSPTGMAADAPDFRSVSYLELFLLLKSLRDARDWSNAATRLIDTYLSDLAMVFCKPELRVLKRTKHALKQVGYHV